MLALREGWALADELKDTYKAVLAPETRKNVCCVVDGDGHSPFPEWDFGCHPHV